ncbi:MAG TPA: VanZ family protein [Candidatus Acidoferrales bacterium]|nr:VanZ family protein [Candidatus Acidoferrales bacterium]
MILWAVVIALLSTRGFDTAFTYKLLKAVNEFWTLGYTVAQLREANAIVRKLAHVSEYFILGLLLWRALRRGRDEAWRWSWAVGTLLLGAAWAGLDELHQLFERGRGSSVVDIGWDSLGLLLALVVIYARPNKKKEGRAQGPALSKL